jgi:hypothetical protein
MITYLKSKGRLGNKLFQVQSLLGLAEKYGHELKLPKWELMHYFDIDIPEFTGGVNCKGVREPNFHYDPDFWQDQLTKHPNVDIVGWLQTEKYFGSKRLRFTEEHKKRVLSKFNFTKPTIAISVRRGDFVDNKNYYQLPISYYIGALLEHFPDYKDHDLVFFSDEPAYIQAHFGCLENAHFPKLSPIEQLILGSQLDNYIISNSTFSWWMAYFNEGKGKVIRPYKNLSGPLEAIHNEKDYWPENWIVYEHEGKKIDLKDVTFTIPVSYDHPDRKQNLDLSLCLLQRDFDTNVIVMEQGGDKFQYVKEWAKYEKFEGKDFHRTRMLNLMAEQAQTDIVVNWDADTFLPPTQIFQAVEKIREGSDMVYPFDGRSARVPRSGNFAKLEKMLDVGIFGGTEFRGMDKYDSVGHCVFFSRQSFINGGMENENMVSFGPEDVERYERFKRLGYKVERIKGPVYHMDHYVGQNSSNRNPYFKSNWQELDRIRVMSDEQLKDYVKGWKWAHPYTEEYYQTIIEKAIKSRDEVFKALPYLAEKRVTKTKVCSFVSYENFNPEFKTVIDIGCGCGEWGVEIEQFGVEKYIGVDHKAPKLLIPKENYIDFDLTSGKEFPVKERFDLAMSLEVAEHLPESCAKYLVDTLCSLSDYILFSAAIPHQSGVNHINEQWQTWWEQLFNQNGYYASEQPLRDLLHDNENCEIWYRNNIVLYSKHFKGKVKDFVHPELFINLINHYKK